MINESPPPPTRPVRRRTLVGLVPLVAGGLILTATTATAAPASAATPAPECLADLLER